MIEKEIKATRERRKMTPGKIVILVFLAVWSVSFFGGFAWLLLNSFKLRAQYIVDNVGWPSPFKFSNYGNAFRELKSTGKSVPIMVWNSLWRVVGSILISQACANVVAYCLAKYRFPGRNLLYWIAIMITMIPIYGTMSASLSLHNMLGIYDNPLHLLAAIGIGGILIPYSCYRNLPWSYAESAFIDGAGHFTVFFRIMLPQMVPVITALSITAFIGGWNDYMTSIVYMPSYPTLATGLYIYQVETQRKYNYPVLFAGIIMSILPVLVLFLSFQKTFMELDLSGGLKG